VKSKQSVLPATVVVAVVVAVLRQAVTVELSASETMRWLHHQHHHHRRRHTTPLLLRG
jgi:hypothetical protein